MDKELRARLEAAGFRVGDAEDFLELTEAERLLVEVRLAVSRAIRRLRAVRGMTQVELAAQIRSSQSRVAKIEAAASDVTLDLSLRTLFTLGGNLADLLEDVTSRTTKTGKRPRKRPARSSPVDTSLGREGKKAKAVAAEEKARGRGRVETPA